VVHAVQVVTVSLAWLSGGAASPEGPQPEIENEHQGEAEGEVRSCGTVEQAIL
jgi:hypothetical protein